MAETCKVLVDSMSEVHTFTGMWTPEKLNKLLEIAEFDDAGDVAESDLMEMCAMVLQDMDHQEAGELALEAVFGDAMRPGVRQNLVDDLTEDRPWDDIAEIAQQKGVFETLILLQQAFPNRYGTPDAMHLKITLSGNQKLMSSTNITPDQLLKVLAGCLADSDILIRLYGDEIKADNFRDAEHIIWWFAESDAQPDHRSFELVTSAQWFSSLQAGKSYQAII